MSDRRSTFSAVFSSVFSRRADNAAYQQVSPDDEEAGKIRLADSDREALLLDEKGDFVAERRGLEVCTCCGIPISCFSFWIVFCISMGGMLVLSALGYAKLVKHSDVDEVMFEPPVFGKELGCVNAPYVYASEKTLYTVPIGQDKHDHYLNIRGGAIGTITLVPGQDNENDTNVSVELTLRTNERALLDAVIVEQHDPDVSANSFWRLNTPYPGAALAEAAIAHARSEKSCMRYDVVLRIPVALRKLHVAAHTLAHIRFGDAVSVVGNFSPSAVPETQTDDPSISDAEVSVPLPQRTLDDFFVTFYSPRKENLLLASTTLAADRLSVEMTGGRLAGSLALRERLRVLTQRGDAEAALHVVTMPVSMKEDGSVPAGELRTVTGSGYTELTVFNPAQRDIESDHLSTGNGDLVLHYEQSKFRGPVELQARAYHAHGLQGEGAGDGHVEVSDKDVKDDAGSEEGSKVALWVEDKDGADAMKVNSLRGWVGLFF